MKLKMMGLGLFLFLHFFVDQSYAKDFQDIIYGYFGNHKAIVRIPDRVGKLPVVIFNYDEMFDHLGFDMMNRKGFNIQAFIDVFASWGFIVIVPLDINTQMHAVRGAIRYAKNMRKANPYDIHLIGASEGAFVSLMALDSDHKVKTLTLILPKLAHYTGYYSLPNLVRRIAGIDTRILMIMGSEEKPWRRKAQEALYDILKQSHQQVVRKDYEGDRKYFWSPYRRYMEHYYTFMTGQSMPILEWKDDTDSYPY